MIDKISSFFDKYRAVLSFFGYLFILLSCLSTLYYLCFVCAYLDVFNDSDLTELFDESFQFGFLASACFIFSVDFIRYFVEFLVKRFKKIKAAAGTIAEKGKKHERYI